MCLICTVRGPLALVLHGRNGTVSLSSQSINYTCVWQHPLVVLYSIHSFCYVTRYIRTISLDILKKLFYVPEKIKTTYILDLREHQ